MRDVDHLGDGCSLSLIDDHANIPRTIYLLQLELEPKDDAIPNELIVPLDPTGQATHTKPLPPKTKMLDVRVGDYIRHPSWRYKIQAVSAYRDATVPDEQVSGVTDGYVVRG